MNFQDVFNPASIPNDIRARVEANGFFIALRDGDYAGVNHHQNRLRELGWDLRPVAVEKPARKPRPTRAA